MEHDVRATRHGDPEMFVLAGPFLCSREVHKELEGPIFSGPNTWWLFATEGDRDVIGFCALRETEGAYWFDYAYVIPDRRGEGVYSALSEERERLLAEMPPKPIRVVCRESRWPGFADRGFSIDYRRGKWIYGRRSPG